MGTSNCVPAVLNRFRRSVLVAFAMGNHCFPRGRASSSAQTRNQVANGPPDSKQAGLGQGNQALGPPDSKQAGPGQGVQQGPSPSVVKPGPGQAIQQGPSPSVVTPGPGQVIQQ